MISRSMKFRLTEEKDSLKESVQGPVKCSGKFNGHNVDDYDDDDEDKIVAVLLLQYLFMKQSVAIEW